MPTSKSQPSGDCLLAHTESRSHTVTVCARSKEKWLNHHMSSVEETSTRTHVSWAFLFLLVLDWPIASAVKLSSHQWDNTQPRPTSGIKDGSHLGQCACQNQLGLRTPFFSFFLSLTKRIDMPSYFHFVGVFLCGTLRLSFVFNIEWNDLYSESRFSVCHSERPALSRNEYLEDTKILRCQVSL